jgi:hypothetical protein
MGRVGPEWPAWQAGGAAGNGGRGGGERRAGSGGRGRGAAAGAAGSGCRGRVEAVGEGRALVWRTRVPAGWGYPYPMTEPAAFMVTGALFPCDLFM